METGRPTVLMIIARPNMFLWGGLREPPWPPSNTIANIFVQRGVGDPSQTIIAVFLFVSLGGVNPMSPSNTMTSYLSRRGSTSSQKMICRCVAGDTPHIQEQYFFKQSASKKLEKNWGSMNSRLRAIQTHLGYSCNPPPLLTPPL